MSDELNDRLSKRFEGETTPEEPESEPEPEPEPETDPTTDDTDGEENDDAYDPETEPAFPYKQRELQNSVYVRKETWQQYQSLRKFVDAHATANGYDKVSGRELDDAILRAVADLDAEEIAELVGETREERADE